VGYAGVAVSAGALVATGVVASVGVAVPFSLVGVAVIAATTSSAVAVADVCASEANEEHAARANVNKRVIPKNRFQFITQTLSEFQYKAFYFTGEGKASLSAKGAVNLGACSLEQPGLNSSSPTNEMHPDVRDTSRHSQERVLKNFLVTRFIGPFSYENLSGQGTFSTPSRKRWKY
jgi:hypothetical protein